MSKAKELRLKPDRGICRDFSTDNRTATEQNFAGRYLERFSVKVHDALPTIWATEVNNFGIFGGNPR